MKWLFGAKGPHLSFDTSDVESANLIQLDYEYLRLDPLGLFFAVTFIFLLVLQVRVELSHWSRSPEMLSSHWWTTYYAVANNTMP